MSAVRNIQDYQRAYAASEFEPVQAAMRKRRLLEVLAQWRPRRILEVGCGSDALFNHHADFDRWHIVEPGEAFAAQAVRDAGGDARIHVVQAFMEEAVPSLQDDRFDCVLLSGLLHEVPDCAPLLAAVARLCTPETRVHVNVPNARSLHRLLALEMGLIAAPNEISERQRRLQQPRTFDLETLRAVCRAGGFEVFEEGSYFVKPFTHSQMAQLQSAGILTERMLDGLMGLEKHVSGLGSEIYVHLRPAAAAREAS